MHVLIIGGSDAGISAALRAQELDPKTEITVLVADSFPNYSICGIPFYLSGETPHWQDLAHRTDFKGINLLLNHKAEGIDASQKAVMVVDPEGKPQRCSYDRLLIATGAMPTKPAVRGLDLPGVFFLHTMEDTFRVHRYLTDQNPRSAVIIGAGYIGVEMADALSHRGLKVTLIGRSQAVLPTVDDSFGQLIEEELQRRSVTVVTGMEITGIESREGSLLVIGSEGFQREADLVLVAAGVRPATALAASAGITLGRKGAICVDQEMRTNITDIFAAGDCVETFHRLLQRYEYLPLGTTAHKQGRIAGENAVGSKRAFAGSLGTQVVKVFELAIARTGLRDQEARAAGFDPVTVESRSWHHKAYYPGARELVFRLTGDRQSGKLLGAQIIGPWQAEVAKRIDIFATALFHAMRVEELNDLDLSYTPPLGSPWDAIQMSAQAWAQAI